jgi:hypothetical protein
MQKTTRFQFHAVLSCPGSARPLLCLATQLLDISIESLHHSAEHTVCREAGPSCSRGDSIAHLRKGGAEEVTRSKAALGTGW